jgi:afadin
MPESKFTRSISKKNGHLHGNRDVDDNSSLRVYANSLLPNGPCKSVLISAHDTSAEVVMNSLERYGLTDNPSEFCLVQVMIPAGRHGGSNPQLNVDYTEHVLGDGEKPLQWRGGRGETVQFHLRRKDSFLHRPHSSMNTRSRSQSPDEMDDPTLPALVEIFVDYPQRPHRFLLSAEATEIGSNSAFASGSDPRGHLCLTSASIKPRHCIIKSSGNNSFTIAPLDKSAVIFVNSSPVHGCQNLDHNSVVKLGDSKRFRFFAPICSLSDTVANGVTSWQHSNSNHNSYDSRSSRGDVSRAKSVENIRNSPLVDEIHQATESRRLKEKAFSEYDLKAQAMGDEGEGGEGERKMNERKRSDPHTHEHSMMEERYAIPRKRHPSAPQSAITNGPLPNNAQPETDQEWVTPLSLSFHQTKQQLLLKKMIMELNMYQLQFKLGPAYGLYMVAKHLYASESQSGSSASERKKTVITGLKSISSHLKRTVKENRTDVGALAFWLANTTELLHFLRQDYQLGLLSNDYDISLIHLTHLIYKYFVACMNKELQVFLPAFYDDSTVADQDDPPAGYTSGPESVLSRIGKEPDVVTSSRSKVSRHSSMSSTHYVGGAKVSRRGRSTIHDVLQTLNSTITILKRCHVNATLSIMVFSNLFRYISVKVFNKLVSGEVKHCGRSLGQRLCKRLGKVKGWAEREGMELPAETHLTMVVEVANLLQASKKHTDNAQTIFASCPHLNSLQMSTLLELCMATDGEVAVNKTLVDDLVHLARGRDDILRGEGLEVQLEEDLHAEHLFQIPGEGYSGETVSGVPGGLQEFLQPMISAGLCKLTVSKDSSGMWSPPVRNVSSSQSMDHSISPQIPESPQTYNTLPKTTTKSHKSSADNEFRHNSLPRHSNPDLKILKVTISKENNTLGISIVAAKLTTNARFNGETGIFVKSTMDGGPADGHLRPGDQILEVDGNDLVGCTQERASQVLRSTGKKVTLLVAKQAAQYYGIQQSSPRYNRNAPEGSSHAKKAARRLKRAQKERQQQERYTAELRLERKQLEHNTELAPSSDLRFPPNTNPQIAKWILEQNALHNSEKGSEVEGPGSTSSLSNIGDQDGRTSSPVSSFATSSSRRTKSSYERYSHRTGSPPIRDSPRPSSRPHEVHSTSPFDAPELLEAQTMSDSASKFSDYSAEPEYSSPAPKSAPPVSSLPRMSYRDAFNSSSLYSQQMSNSLTPYSQQQVPSQPGHLDKLSMDVMYHTPQSGASLSGISSIVPRMQGKGGKPYLGRVHLKELDGDEIDLEKQRIKLMFYEKKNEERALQEEDEASLQQEGATTDPLQKGYTSSPPPPPMNTGHQFQGLSSLEEDQGKAFWDDEGQSPEVRELLHELTTLEHMVTEQRRHYKELKYARERENLNLQKAEVDFHEQELLEPAAGGVMSMSATHQDKWQKEQKKRLRQLERFRTEQKDKMQKIEVEEHHTRAKLKAFEANINELRQQIDILVTNGHPKSSAVVESHVQPYRSEYLAEGTDSRGSPIFTGELQSRDDHLYRPGDTDTGMPPERDWPKEAANSKPNPGRFISVESLNSAANEPPDFSRELVNTISESTNMTEPTQDDLVPSRWSSKFVPSSDDPYAAEFSSKFSYSDDEFFMDNTRMKFESGSPIDAHPFNSTSERDVRRPMYHQPPHLPNSHATGHHNLHVINGGGAINQPPDEEIDDSGPLQWAGGHHKKRGPPPVSEKPQNYTGGRTGHHYSRSNRPRMHNRNHQLHSSENLSTVSGVSAASSHTTNQEFLKDDIQKTSSAQFTRESTKPSLNRTADPAPQSPSYLASVTPSSPPQPPYSPSSPSNTSAAVYDIPRKASNKPAPSTAIPTAIYDMPRPSSSSPQHKVNHGNPPLPPNSSSPQPISSLYGSKPQDISRSPFHSKSHDRPTPNYSPHEQQHYDVPKPLSEQNRPSAATLPAEHATTRPPTAANTTTHLYNYHGLPTKPSAPRSYSRGRQDAVGYPADRGFRGQVSRPTHSQRVQRQQTEL